MTTGKSIRMRRIVSPRTGKAVVFPFDHGYFLGPIPGAVDFRAVVETAVEKNVQALLLTRGLAEATADIYGGRAALILRISGMTALGIKSDYEVIVTQVESALRLGADAVAVTIHLGSEREQEMLVGLGRVVDECSRYRLPVLGEIMFGGELASRASEPEMVAWAARMGQEAGSDFLKLNHPGSAEGMRQVVAGVSIPIVIAGGEKKGDTAEVYAMAAEAMEGGARGICIGRNIFQAEDPAAVLARLQAIVHEGKEGDRVD